MTFGKNILRDTNGNIRNKVETHGNNPAQYKQQQRPCNIATDNNNYCLTNPKVKY